MMFPMQIREKHHFLKMNRTVVISKRLHKKQMLLPV